jgi:polyisoprenoid-binding protein YceI
VNRFPEILFDSESAERSEAGAWTVRGQLTLHGQTRPLTTTVSGAQGHYKGSLALKQSDFGIAPIKVAGGAVKVKDQLTIDFDIVARAGVDRRTE